MSFANLSHRDFNDRLADGSPTPGGGSAAALSAAMAAAAVEMVCNLSIDKTDDEEVEANLKTARDELRYHRDVLEQLADDDSEAFQEVMSAFRLEQGPDRTEAIQSAMKHAASVPMDTATRCLAITELAVQVAGIGNPNAITDAGAGGLFAHAAMEAALFNVEINLASIEDESFVEEMSADVADRRDAGTEAVARLTDVVRASF